MIQNIYIVDDDDLVRSSIFSLLSFQSNRAVQSFASGDLFLRAAPDLDPGVVLLDFRMPGLNGVDVLNALREMPSKRFATVVATGEGDTQLAVQMMKLGAVDFLEKPYEGDALFGVVDAAFAHLSQDQGGADRLNTARSKVAGLSPRERDVLVGLIDGQANKVIAHNLEISPRTVEIYRANLMSKLAVTTLSQALRIAFTAGMLPIAA